MVRYCKLLAMLFPVVLGSIQAFAETHKFPSGRFYYVSCAKLPSLTTKEDARPGVDRLNFGFSDTKEYHVDLIVGPVRSDADKVVFSYTEDAQAFGTGAQENSQVWLSRITGVLTINDKTRSKESRYLCESSSPYGVTF